MNISNVKNCGLTILVALYLLVGFSFAVLPATASDHEFEKEHGERQQRSLERDDEGHHASPNRDDEKNKDHQGSEGTGMVAALLLIAGNMTVLASLSIKAAIRGTPLPLLIKEKLARLNRSQKKYLRWPHYLLNPAALAFALTHFGLSSCNSTVLPECGLIFLALLMALGLPLKFKWSSGAWRKPIFRIHTHPVMLGAMIAILTIGHAMVD